MLVNSVINDTLIKRPRQQLNRIPYNKVQVVPTIKNVVGAILAFPPARKKF